MVFQADYDKIKLQKISNDVISVTSLTLRHRKNVTKIMSQIFFQFGSLPIKISDYASGSRSIITFFKGAGYIRLIL